MYKQTDKVKYRPDVYKMTDKIIEGKTQNHFYRKKHMSSEA